MLISKEMLAKVQVLTLPEVRTALKYGGYKQVNDIRSVEFKGMDTNGTFCYGITFDCDEGDDSPGSETGIGRGNVYVSIVRKPMSRDFVFSADY